MLKTATLLYLFVTDKEEIIFIYLITTCVTSAFGCEPRRTLSINQRFGNHCTQHSTRFIPESRSYTLNSSRENLRTGTNSNCRANPDVSHWTSNVIRKCVQLYTMKRVRTAEAPLYPSYLRNLIFKPHLTMHSNSPRWNSTCNNR
jgi:hypothetical protein